VLRRGDHLQPESCDERDGDGEVHAPELHRQRERPAGNGNVSCTSPVLHNQSSVCTLAPAAGYKLSQLTDNASDVTVLVVSNAYTISSVSANHASLPPSSRTSARLWRRGRVRWRHLR